MGARELMRKLTGAGFSLAADGEKLVIRPASKLTDELRDELRAAKPELLSLLTAPTRPYKLTPAEGNAAHAAPLDDAASAHFPARMALLLRRGIGPVGANDLADRLHLRDVQGDDRRMCVECRHLVGRAGDWRCGNHREAGVGRDLPAVLTTTMQRCPAFGDASAELCAAAVWPASRSMGEG